MRVSPTGKPSENHKTRRNAKKCGIGALQLDNFIFFGLAYCAFIGISVQLESSEEVLYKTPYVSATPKWGRLQQPYSHESAVEISSFGGLHP